jgi:sulfate transport system permease protein
MKSTAYALEPSRGERFARHLTTLYLIAIVAVPLLALLWYGVGDGLVSLKAALTSPVALHALWLTLWTSALVAGINLVLGTATAFVLVRYHIPGKALLSALIDLPLAIPTLVTGVMLAILYGPESVLGRSFTELGFPILFAKPSIVLALAFVTLPFVIRAVEPVLIELDPGEEEAAFTLGAGPVRTFRTVILPAIAPAALSASIRSLGRAMGEFGSIVVVAGNIPMKTLTAPVYILGEIESGAPRAAAAVSVLVLAAALALHALAHLIERQLGARNA